MAGSEVKQGTKDGEEGSVPLNFKTSVLRVSIHCEGCKRKVEKVLRKIQGVYKTEIDIKQQMVTVMGEVEAETLIKRLRKEGKNAELWPQKPQKPQKPVKAKNKERQSDPNDAKEAQKEGQSVKTEAPEKDQNAKADSEGSGKEASEEKATQGVEPATDGAGAGAKKGKQKEEENAATSAGDRLAAEKQPLAGEGEGGAEKSGSNGSASKKKKKQGQNGKKAEGEGASSGERPARSEEPKNLGQSPEPNASGRSRQRQQAGQNPLPPHFNGVPAGPGSPYEWEGQGPTLAPSRRAAAPGHHEHWYPPPPHHAPPAHAFDHPYGPSRYAVNHQMAYPGTSYAASLHLPDPPLLSHVHEHPGIAEERPPYYYPGSYHPPSSNSFEIFSDENPNACSIM